MSSTIIIWSCASRFNHFNFAKHANFKKSNNYLFNLVWTQWECQNIGFC